MRPEEVMPISVAAACRHAEPVTVTHIVIDAIILNFHQLAVIFPDADRPTKLYTAYSESVKLSIVTVVHGSMKVLKWQGSPRAYNNIGLLHRRRKHLRSERAEVPSSFFPLSPSFPRSFPSFALPFFSLFPLPFLSLPLCGGLARRETRRFCRASTNEGRRKTINKVVIRRGSQCDDNAYQ